MAQLARGIASATSFAGKRSYAQNMRLPASALPAANASVSFSNPGSPTAGFFAQLGSNARTVSQSQVPFASNPDLPLGISPASQPRLSMWATSPPRSPSQLHFRMQQMPSSPSQLLFGTNVAAFTPAQAVHEFGFTFGIPESVSPVFTGSPATSSRSMSPACLDASQPSALSVQAGFSAASTSPVRKPKREEVREGKKGLNPFTYYRKTFPARYPHIDVLIPTQMERSRLTGAFWQHESTDVREKCEAAVYINRTQAQIERLESVRLHAQEKRRQERIKAGTDKLTGRNALIFKLWQRGVPTDQFTATVLAYDRENPLPEPARKRRRKTAVPKPDTGFMLAAETASIASSSPHPSTSSISQSPYIIFNPELPSAIGGVQSNWAPLSTEVMQGNYEPGQPDVITVELPEPVAFPFAPLTSQQTDGMYMTPEAMSTTLYDGMLTDFSSNVYPLGSDEDMDAILQAYSQQQPFPQDGLMSDMDHDYNFMPHALPTEEDGLLFDVAYFGPSSALDA